MRQRSILPWSSLCGPPARWRALSLLLLCTLPRPPHPFTFTCLEQFHISTVPPVYTAEGEITSACWSLKLLEAFWTESPPKLFEATSFWSFYQFQLQWKSWALVSSTWIQDPHAINWNMCLSAQFSSVHPNSSKCSLCELQILGRKLAENSPSHLVLP